MEDDATEIVISERDFQLKRMEEIRNTVVNARETGNWENVPADVYLQYLSKVEILTLSTVPGREIKQTLGILSSEGLFVIPMPGLSENRPRTEEAEKQIQQSGMKMQEKLRIQALNCNADAVIDVKTSHNLIGLEGDHHRFLIVTTGTAVKLR